MKQNLRKFLAALTGLSLALACLPGAALAEPADPTAGLCPHHTEHTAECGYRAAVEAHECGHVHDETCGYAEAKDEVPCDQNCAADAEEGQSVTHKEGCAYQIAQAASPCTHVHDEACGYAEADDGAPCAFECALCAVAVYANPNLTLFVSDSDGAPVTQEGDHWELSGGEYTVMGVSTATEYLSISGTTTVHLGSSSITHSTTELTKLNAAIRIEAGAAVTLDVQEAAYVEGSMSCAAIYVAPGATLTITGKGSLTAVGGKGSKIIRNVPMGTFANQEGDGVRTSVYFCGGAGIGGNGVGQYGCDVMIDGHDSPNFGTIVLDGANVTARGGDMLMSNAGAGAGIGGGGGSTQGGVYYQYEGTLSIKNNSFVSATGGDSQDFSLTGGGAGVGAGGVTGNYFVPFNNSISVSIDNSQVIAYGKADGAGIGGGANVDGGVISISGEKTMVMARGGYEIEDGAQSAGYGGAGIGGGDNGGVTSITITGGEISAIAKGAAAGIGGGNDGGVGVWDYDSDTFVPGSITINGTAKVVAQGGSHTNVAKGGGAGIGGGRSYYVDGHCSTITLGGSADITAMGGAGAQAIGVGAFYGDDLTQPNLLTIDGTNLKLWAHVADDSPFPALLDETVSPGSSLRYSVAGGAKKSFLLRANPNNPNTVLAYETYPGEAAELPCELRDNMLYVDGQLAGDVVIGDTLPDDWSTLFTPAQFQVSYRFVGTVPEGAVLPQPAYVMAGSAIEAETPAAVEGYTFDGWYLDEGCTTLLTENDLFEADVTLYGRFVEVSNEVKPNVTIPEGEQGGQDVDEPTDEVPDDGADVDELPADDADNEPQQDVPATGDETAFLFLAVLTALAAVAVFAAKKRVR